MKIGFVIDDHMSRAGGVQEAVRGLRQYLVGQGHATVIFSGGGGRPEPGVVPLGLSVPFHGSGSSSSFPLTLQTPGQLRALLAREACDVLHVTAPYSPTLSGRLLAQSRAANVMNFHVTIEPAWFLRSLGVLARAQRRSLGRFHARLAVSHVAARAGRTLYGGAYTVVPDGVDVERFRPPRDQAGRDNADGVTILYVGRLEERKGVAHLLRAVARLQAQTPGVRLCIGGNGPEREALERLAGELALTDVQFLGYVPGDDLPGLLHSADIFCAPATHAECFGRVLIEAMAAGLPVVAAANAGYAEVLAAHPGNLLAPPGDDRALAGALQALAAAPAYRRALGKRNVMAAQRYRWENVGAAIVEVYQQALIAWRNDA